MHVASAAVVVALTGALFGCGGATTTTSGATATSSEASTTVTAATRSGADVFATVCAGCHGADGTGVTGPDLTVRSDLAKERIVDQVTNGGSRMPEYGSTLTPDEISAVADYVLSDIVK